MALLAAITEVGDLIFITDLDLRGEELLPLRFKALILQAGRMRTNVGSRNNKYSLFQVVAGKSFIFGDDLLIFGLQNFKRKSSSAVIIFQCHS